MKSAITQSNIAQTFRLLAGRLDLAQTEPVRLVVCGGSALIAMGLRQRTTRDVDVVALLDAMNELTSPDPLPEFLLTAAAQVARDLGLSDNWLNNGPSRGEGGLFQMGLPAGLQQPADSNGVWIASDYPFHWASRPNSLQALRRSRPTGRHTSERSQGAASEHRRA